MNVEKVGKGFLIKVIHQKGGHNLVPILEVFEEMGLIVLHARVSCNFFFSMEVIVVAEEEHDLDVKNVSEAVLQAMERHVERANRSI